MTVAFAPSVFRAAAMVSGLRPVTRTRAPSACRSWAVARPMPVVPPVIRMFLFFIGKECVNYQNDRSIINAQKSVEKLQGQAGTVPQGVSLAQGPRGDAETEQGVVEKAGERDGVLGLADLALALGRAES